MKVIFPVLICLLLVSCDHSLTHERVIANRSEDTVTIFNPDFQDTTYLLLPGENASIYSFKVLDTKQEMEPCKWLGDNLVILSIHDSVCNKNPFLEGSWISKMGGSEKNRSQTCTMTLEIGDFD